MAKYTLYNKQGQAFRFDSVAYFCKETRLPAQSVRDVLRGTRKSVMGWHLDDEATQAHEVRVTQIMAQMGWTDQQDEEDGGILLTEVFKRVKA